MARITNSTWLAILGVAAVLLIIAMVTSGYFIWGLAILVLLLALGGGALLYHTQGPPRE